MWVDKTQSAMVSTDGQLLALKAQRMAEQREWETFQSMMTSRFAEKDAFIASLQQQIAELPDDAMPRGEQHRWRLMG